MVSRGDVVPVGASPWNGPQGEGEVGDEKKGRVWGGKHEGDVRSWKWKYLRHAGESENVEIRTTR